MLIRGNVEVMLQVGNVINFSDSNLFNYVGKGYSYATVLAVVEGLSLLYLSNEIDGVVVNRLWSRLAVHSIGNEVELVDARNIVCTRYGDDETYIAITKEGRRGRFRDHMLLHGVVVCKLGGEIEVVMGKGLWAQPYLG